MDERIAGNILALMTGKKRMNLTGDEVSMFVEAVIALKKIANPPPATPADGEKGSTTV